ncbi:MAG TPA: hypothetical protein VGF35_03620 [Steroidobacteraceae bacterium]
MSYLNKLLLAAFVCLAPLAVNADLPGAHPAYLHALSDLRSARWMLEHRPGGLAVSGQEDVAITEIDKAIGEIKHAAIDDGKDVHDHPAVDVPPDNPGRLHKALELLHKAHADVAGQEDDPMTQGLRDRALQHIHLAAVATKTALAYAGQPH